MESIPYPLVYYKPGGAIKGCNKYFESFFNLHGKTIIDSVIYDLSLFPNGNELKRTDQKLLQSQICDTSEIEMNGNTFLLTQSLYYNNRLIPDGIFCILIDITELKSAHLEILDGKKRELASNAIRLINMSEMNSKIIEALEKANNQPDNLKGESIRNIVSQLNNKSAENIWNEFELHFNSVFENFHQTLKEQFSDLAPGELRLCSFLRLKLSSKEIAALTIQNPKSIDMARYRLRKKMKLQQDENLIDFLMQLN